MKPRPIAVPAALILLAATWSAQRAAAVTIPVEADTRILKSAPTTNSGGFDAVAVYDNGAGNMQRTLLQFDLGSLPAGELVTSATLRLTAHPSRTVDNSANVPMEVYRLSRPWVESQVTWNVASSGDNWSTPGGDFAGTGGSTPYAASSDDPAPGSPVEWDVTQLVSEWHQGLYSNNGLALAPPGSYTSPIMMHFASKEYTGAAPGAELEVESSAGYVVTSLEAAADTRIGNTLPGPQGLANHLGVMNDPSQPNVQRALLQFDLDDLPGGLTVESAVVVLYRHSGPDGRNPDHVLMDVFRLTRPWEEAEATWGLAASGDPWSGAGADGDFVGISGLPGVDPFALNGSDPDKFDVVAWDVTSLVRGWYGGTFDNNGLLVLSEDPTGAPNKLHFFSRESGGAEFGPRLFLVLRVPEPASVTLAAVGLLAMVGVVPSLSRRRRRRRCA